MTALLEVRALRASYGDIRALHSKMLALQSDRTLLVMIGSSNFTRAGFGLDSSAANIEANLV